jgi:uncharacterized protein (PEP-CTERM system associated)
MKKRIRITLAIVVSVMQPAFAAKWTATSDVGKSVDLSVTYSDNSNLAGSGNSQSDTTSEVRPSFHLKGEGGRMTLDFDYALAAALESDNTAAGSRLKHFLSAKADIEAWEKVVFVDIAANAGVTAIDSTAPTSTGIYSNSSNTTQTYSFSVTPRIVHHYGNYADSVLTLRADTVQNNSSRANDSDSVSANYLLSSGSYFGRLGWSVSASQSKLSNDNDVDDDATIFNTNFRYRINRLLSANVSLGYEDRDFQTNQFSDTNDVTWDVGASWTPNPRTSASLSYGERFYGDHWSMNLKYRHRRSTITASYLTSLVTSRQLQLEAILLGPATDDDGNPIFNDLGEQQFLVLILPTLGVENIVQDQFKLAYLFQGKKTSVRLDTAFADRSFQLSGNSTESVSTNLRVSRRLTPRTSVTAGLSWVEKKDNANSDQELVSFRIGVKTEVGNKSNIRVDLQRSENDDSAGTNDYTENRITASLGLTF